MLKDLTMVYGTPVSRKDSGRFAIILCARASAEPGVFSLRHTIVRAPNCGGDCRPWGGKMCAGGWQFTLDGCEYVKFRYNAFMFSMIKDKLCDVRDMLQMELDSRIH